MDRRAVEKLAMKHMQGNTPPGRPSEWVLRAILEAYDRGVSEGEANGHAIHEYHPSGDYPGIGG